MSSLKVQLVTAADAAYFDTAQGLLRSIRDEPRANGLALAVLDCGLSDPQHQWLADHDIAVVAPEWDADPPPGAGNWFKAMTARPHLPRWLPGADIYCWLDGDCWIQDWQAVENLIKLARDCGAAAAIERDPAYVRQFLSPFSGQAMDRTALEAEMYFLHLGAEGAHEIARFPMINSGVFALRADAPVWPAWATSHREVLARGVPNYFHSEQVAFNVALRRHCPTFKQVSADYNWLCVLALPWLAGDDRTLIAPPAAPGQPPRRIGIVHMCGGTRLGTHPLHGVDGRTIQRSLAYSGRVLS